MKKFITIFLVCSLIFINNASAVNIKYKHYTLDNGLEIYVMPNNRVAATTHMLIFKVGSIDEPVGQSGIAHFFEHAMFQGTDKYPGNSYSQEIGKFGGAINAFTSDDLTGYFADVPADKLEKIMELESDRLQNLRFIEEGLMHEREVVMEERRMRVDNFPHVRLFEQLQSSLFLNSQYRVLTIGWMHEIAKITVQNLKDFYNIFYAPNNAILIVTGDVRPDEVHQLAQKYYGKISKKDVPERIILTEPTRAAKSDLIMYDENSTVDSLMKAYLAPSINDNKKDMYAIDLLAYILGGSDSSVLYNELVLNQNLATNVNTRYENLKLGPTSFMIFIEPVKDKIFEIKDEDISNIIHNLKKKTISDQQLLRAKNNLKNSFEIMVDGYHNMANIVAYFLSVGATIEDINEYSKNIDKVTKEDIYAAIDKIFIEKNAVTAKLVKNSKKIEDSK